MLLNAKEADVLPSLSINKKNKISREITKFERQLKYYQEFEDFIDSVDRGNLSLPQRKEILAKRLEIENARKNFREKGEKDDKGKYLKKLKKKVEFIRQRLITIRDNLKQANREEYEKKEDLFLFNKRINNFLTSFEKLASHQFFVVTREKYDALKKNPDTVGLQEEIEKRMRLVTDVFPALFVVLSREAIPGIDALLEQILMYDDGDAERLELMKTILKIAIKQMKKSLLKFNDKRQLIAKSRIEQNAVITEDPAMIERVAIGVNLKKLNGIDLQFEVSKMPPIYVLDQFRDFKKINCHLTAKNKLSATRVIEAGTLLYRNMTDDELLRRAKITPQTFISIEKLKDQHQLARTRVKIDEGDEDNEETIDLTLRINLLDDFLKV